MYHTYPLRLDPGFGIRVSTDAPDSMHAEGVEGVVEAQVVLQLYIYTYDISMIYDMYICIYRYVYIYTSLCRYIYIYIAVGFGFRV